jgi:hypothetical protein
VDGRAITPDEARLVESATRAELKAFTDRYPHMTRVLIPYLNQYRRDLTHEALASGRTHETDPTDAA